MLDHTLGPELCGWNEWVLDWEGAGGGGEVAEEEVGAETGAVEDEDAWIADIVRLIGHGCCYENHWGVEFIQMTLT